MNLSNQQHQQRQQTQQAIERFEQTNKQTKCIAWYDSSLVTDFQPEMFSPDFWQQQQAITGKSHGRGTTWFVRYQQQDWVLRHYYRGGLIGKFNKDHYLFTSAEQSRAYQEFQLLLKLQQLGLPAPAPVACQIIKKGPWYQADLLSARITNAQDLVSLLSKQSISTKLWHNIGATIQAFHQQGIFHHDLNIHNILINDQEQVFLIDFDQGQQRTVAQSWQQQNMRRLLRSFRKEKTKLETLHWQEDDWQYLLEGYLS